MGNWNTDLQKALSVSPNHISTYGLTIEKGTQFWNSVHHGKMDEIDEDVSALMYEKSINVLNGAGFEHYEVSNFAMPSHRSIHNEVYWQHKPFLGFGAGAASFLQSTRTVNHRSTKKYINRVSNGECSFEEVEELSADLLARERLVFGLRRLEGIDTDEFKRQTGNEIWHYAESALHRFVDQGLLTLQNKRLKLTRQGLMISDSLWPELL